MKFLCVFLLFGCCLASENDWFSDTGGYEVNERPLFRRPIHRTAQEHLQYHKDHHIERPCPNLEEHCIRVFLAKNSKCRPTFGPAPEPYFMTESHMDVPHANMSLDIYDVKNFGFNSGRIKEFYINRKTDRLVLEVEFKKIVVDSPKTVMSYYRKGKEPIQATDFSVIEFRHLSLTLTVEHINEINPDKGHVYVQLSDTPLLKMGPGLVNVQGLSTSSMGWLSDLDLTSRETLLSQAPLYFAVYLQSKICDFRHL